MLRTVSVCATEDKAASTWSSALLQLPPKVLSFSLKVAQDTLPHNANLAVWRKRDGLSDVCKLFKMRQTLAHALNQCPFPLHLRRYNSRHYTVKWMIKCSIRPLLSDVDCLIAYLNSHQSYTFPFPHHPLQSLLQPTLLEHQQPHNMSSTTHHLFRNKV